MKNFPKYFKKGEITLKIIEPTFKNAVMMYEVIDKNRDHLLPYMDWATKDMTKTPEDTFIFLEGSKKGRESGEKFEFGIFVEGKLCGTFGIHGISKKHKSCEIGYWLAKDATGKGIVSQSLEMAEDFLFSKYDMNRIVIRCNALNTASANVAKRNGYKLDGIEREVRFSIPLDRMVDGMIFSKLYSEWKGK